MKKLMMLAVLVPSLGWASLPGRSDFPNPATQPNLFSTFSETRTLEWGCPVADRVSADSEAEAILRVRRECLEEATKAAASKPEVVDVIQTKVIWPDVHVLQLSDGYHLSGTFFLETTVVQRMTAEVR